MKCRADLRVCLNCQSYDPRVAQQCRERRAEPVLEKATVLPLASSTLRMEDSAGT